LANVTAAGSGDLFGFPVELMIFAAILLGVALFHRHTLTVALSGLAAITLCKLVTGFAHGAGLAWLAAHLAHEWVILANLFLLLTGFALLSRHFELSKMPEAMPAVLPDDWKGGLMLLVIICALSAILDNIAAALIGGTVAKYVFSGRVHASYVAAIVAASNAGGAGSVVGDTTTTMMWIAGVSPLSLVEAYVAVAVATAHLRHSGSAAATALLAHRARWRRRHWGRMDPRSDRASHSGRSHRSQFGRQRLVSVSAGAGARDRSRGLDCDPSNRARAQT